MVSRQQISIPAMVTSDPDISNLGLSFLSYLSLASAGGRFPASPNPELLGVLPCGDWLMESHMYLLSCCLLLLVTPSQRTLYSAWEGGTGVNGCGRGSGSEFSHGFKGADDKATHSSSGPYHN